MIRSIATVCAFALLTAAASAQSTIYSNLPAPLAGSYPSLAYAARSTSEYGDRVNFDGTDRLLQSATVVMSSWARTENFGNAVSYDHSFTFNVYAAGPGNTVGALLGSVTQTATVPYRPLNYATNGIAFSITFDLSSLTLTAPDSIVYGVATDYSSGGATLLNYALNTSAGGGITVGSNHNLDDLYFNSTFPGFYSDGGAGGVGVFRQNTGWTGYAPIVEFTATPTPGAAALLGLGGLALGRRRRA